MLKKYSRALGFSLIELMIAVSIIAVLAAIAIPSYSNYATKARRSDAHQLLLDISNKQKQYLLDARSYTAALNATGLNLVKDGWTCTATTCSNAFYDVAIPVIDNTVAPPIFTARATAKGTQAADGNLEINHVGTKTGKW